MRLWELEHQQGKLPKEMGKALMVYSDDEKEPSRKGNVITIPNGPFWDFFPLGKEQFIFVSNHFGCWFGGTDENPFLVRLDQSATSRFVESRGKVEAFYASIKPPFATSLERRFGTKSIRQGDIWATPVGETWKSIIDSHRVAIGVQFTAGMAPKENRIFGTRHTLKGNIVEDARLFGIGQTIVLVSGVISAPDHSDMVVEQPSILSQTHYLYAPEKAD